MLRVYLTFAVLAGFGLPAVAKPPAVSPDPKALIFAADVARGATLNPNMLSFDALTSADPVCDPNRLR